MEAGKRMEADRSKMEAVKRSGGLKPGPGFSRRHPTLKEKEPSLLYFCKLARWQSYACRTATIGREYINNIGVSLKSEVITSWI